MTEIGALPDRPYCTLAEAQRYVEGQTGESASGFYRRVQEGKYPTREIAGRKLMSTRQLREMFGDEREARDAERAREREARTA